MSDVLPILEKRADIEAAIRAHPVVVVCGETGSGKTTQLPQMCLELGLAQRRMIGHTQPRRLAARAVAARIAEERGERIGGTVGVKVRFLDQTSSDTRIKLMTDGMLLAELPGDPRLAAYSTIILDEAHERSLNVDFLLGYLRTLLSRRDDLKLIITSATIDPARFSAFFGGPRVAPVIEVSGRSYPVDIRYRPTDAAEEDFERLEVEAVADAVEDLAARAPGDVLVFVPGEREIRGCADAVRKRGIDVDVLPLFARLTNEEQDRIFHPGARRRVIVATNIAETSLTVPRIRCVVDTGLARIKRYDPQKKVLRLPIEPISRASAAQRSGRCGRIAAGVCVRLYSEPSFKERAAFTDPEIRRTSLAGVVLQMRAMGLGHVEDFPFIDPPDPHAVRDGYETLFELGALDTPGREGSITDLGRAMSRVPTDPRIARVLLAADREGCLAEALILAAALSIQDPRQRPLSRQEEADRAQTVFRHESSDFMTLLKLWDQYRHAADTVGSSALQSWCRDHFLSAARMREWSEMIRQLAETAADLNLKPGTSGASEDSVHRALLTGLISNVACREGDGGSFEYRGVRGNVVHLFPGSVLFKKGPRWIMAAEFVHTTRLYARTVARVDPAWIEDLAAHMFQRQVSDPHFDAQSGEPGAWERVTMSGIVVVPRRRVRLAGIDPKAARRLFVREGLAQMKWPSTRPFMTANRATLVRARDAEARLRRRNLVRPEDEIAEWFEARLDPHAMDPASFERVYPDPASGPAHLTLSLHDVLRPEAHAAFDPGLFPDSINVGGVECTLRYSLAPGKDEDGVTLEIPLTALAQLPDHRPGWLVSGMIPELVQAMVKVLPKPLRAAIENQTTPADLGLAFADVMRFGEGPIAHALSETVRVLYGVDTEPAAWSDRGLPGHLRMRITVMDEHGRTLGTERDLGLLRARFKARMERARSAGARASFERHGLTVWDFDELPSSVEVSGDGGSAVAFPAIVDSGATVSLALMESEPAAAAWTVLGLRRLFSLACAEEVGHYLESLPGWDETKRRYQPYGGAAQLTEDAACVIAERVFLWGQAPIRTRAAFETRSRDMWGRLAGASREVGEAISRVLEARQRVAQRLSGGTPRLWADSVADMREHAAFLLPRGFFRRQSWERLRAFPRYAEALRERLLALREDGSGVEKEALRRMLPHWKRLTAWVAAAMSAQRAAAADAGGASRPARSATAKAPLPQTRRVAAVVNVDAGEWLLEPGVMPPVVERFRWALEDYRAVVFAPGRAGADLESELTSLAVSISEPARSRGVRPA